MASRADDSEHAEWAAAERVLRRQIRDADRPEQRVERMWELAWGFERTCGDPASALTLYQAAESTTPDNGLAFAQTAFFLSRQRRFGPDLGRRIETALRLLESSSPMIRYNLELVRSHAQLNDGQARAALASLERARAILEECDQTAFFYPLPELLVEMAEHRQLRDEVGRHVRFIAEHMTRVWEGTTLHRTLGGLLRPESLP